MRKNIKLVIIMLFVGACAFASEGEHTSGHEEIVIPLTEIGWQAANLGILLIALFFFLRKSVIETFANRKTEFINKAEKTKQALKLAEDDLRDTKAKLSQLENGETKALENAKHEASLIKNSIIKESEAQAVKLITDAQASIQTELMKATAEIKLVIFNEAIVSSKEKISSQINQNLKAIEAGFLQQVDSAKNNKAGL
ncbi:MAG: ATP synthase F0 subunit B [Pseudobdellovibrio sp.]